MFKFVVMLACGVMTGLLISPDSQAKVERFEVVESTPAFEGREFGEVGGYERIDAIAYFAIDPDSERGRMVVDLEHAPLGDDGLVRYSTEVTVLRPADESKGSGVLLYDVPNRGRVLSFILLEQAEGTTPPDTAERGGDGFLMESGHTIVWSGWQTGLSDESIALTVPTLENVTGPSREEIVFDKPGTTGTLKLSYPSASMDPAEASLSVRQYPADQRSTAPGLGFRYVSNSEVEIMRPEGLNAGAIYEFIYTATDSLPTGLGFTATSDLVSFLRGNEGHDIESPLTGVQASVALGISQSGRYLRDFVYQGFNADEQATQVFDAVMPYIAGSRKTFVNYRFAQQGRYSRQHEDHDFPGDQFPFTYVELTDPVSGRTDGILSACGRTDTCPKVMHADTSTEFWQARSALISTAPDGTPLEMPDSVRVYFLAGLQHFNAFSAQSKANEVCRFPSNPVAPMPVLRTLVNSLAEWARDDTPPPPSRFPSVADGTLVSLEQLALPDLPEDNLIPVYNELRVRDHSTPIPTGGKAYPALVPQTDSDGNPNSGVKLPRVAAPLGTYWGWNVRNEDFAEGALCGLTGSFIPFSVSTTDGDSRPGIADRYADEEAYIAAVVGAAETLSKDGFMPIADLELVANRAAEDYRAAVQ
ncbi:MAG: alpha/beta hydrolase domain-containing protein [Granulosicoccus sp.]